MSSKDTNLTTYLVNIAYDGTNFFGWSKQPKLRTVEGEIIRILKKIFHLEISINGSSRTDTKVHAYDQYFTFLLNKEISVEKIKLIFKQSFKNDIKILEVKIVHNGYDLRKHFKLKEYHYYINTGSSDPFKVNYEYQYGRELLLDNLNKAFNCFIGDHYFYNFSGLGSSSKKEPYRVIEDIKVEKKGSTITISISGRGFLRYQVRYLIAAAIKYCEGRVTIEELKNYLNPKCQKKFPYGKVPGSGLYLYKTIYK